MSTSETNESRIASNNTELGDWYLKLGEYGKAIDYYKIGLEMNTAIGDKLGIATNNGDLGSAYLRLDDYRMAIDYCKIGLELSTAIDDKSGITSNNCHWGVAYRCMGDYETAINYFKKSLEMSKAIGDMSRIVCNIGNLGDVCYCLGDWEKAIEYYKKCLEIKTANSDKSGIACYKASLGNVYIELGDYGQAIENYKESLAISISNGEKTAIATITGNLGSASICLGAYKEAIEYFEKALEMTTAIGNKSEIANNNRRLGVSYLRLGDYVKAIEYFAKGLDIGTAIGDKSTIAAINGDLGDAYLCLGDYEKSLDYFKTSLEINTAIGGKSGIAGNNINLGIANFCLGNSKMAIDYYKIGVEISTKIGDKSAIAKGNGNLGNAYLSLGDYKKAIHCFYISLKMNTAIGDKSAVGKINANLGNAFRRLGEYKSAIHYHKLALEISAHIGDKLAVANVNGNLGNCYRSSGEYKSAVLYLMKSISISDELFLNSVPDQNRLSFVIEYFKRHEILMSCFISLKLIKSGLLALDLGRAKELHFSIERKQKNVGAGNNNNNNNKKTLLLDYANTIWNRIENKEEHLEIEEIKNALKLESSETSVLVFSFDKDDRLNVWILNDEVVFRPSISDAQLEMYVQLISMISGRVGVILNRDSSFFNVDSVANLHSLMINTLDIQRKISEGGDVVKYTPDEGNFSNESILKKLFQLLIEPLKDVLKGKKLIVVPDKQLFFAPFSSLIDENGCYLSRSYSVQVTPSLHTLKFSMEQSHDSDFGFALFVGNPSVGKVSLNGVELTPSALPNATKEVECLSKFFKARPLVGREARKQVVLGLLSGASIIHIAAHGESRRGEIMLAPDVSSTQPSSSPPNEKLYLLTQQDITSISLQAHLVVLCCCHTGQGEISSEGVIGIARAFLAAGARSVLSALWPINDDGTKEFMKAFYGELCQETSVCEALRKTKCLFQKHEKEAYRSVTIWAPFTIYGEDVMFKEDDIKNIIVKSREMFSDFVVLP